MSPSMFRRTRYDAVMRRTRNADMGRGSVGKDRGRGALCCGGRSAAGGETGCSSGQRRRLKDATRKYAARNRRRVCKTRPSRVAAAASDTPARAVPNRQSVPDNHPTLQSCSGQGHAQAIQDGRPVTRPAPRAPTRGTGQMSTAGRPRRLPRWAGQGRGTAETPSAARGWRPRRSRGPMTSGTPC